MNKNYLIFFAVLLICPGFLLANYIGIGDDNIKNMVNEVKKLTNLNNKKSEAKSFEKTILIAKDEITRLNAEASEDPSAEINRAALALESTALSLIQTMKRIRAADSNDALNKELAQLKKIRDAMNRAFDPADKGYLAKEKVEARDYLLAVKHEALEPFLKDANAAAWDKMTAAGFPTDI